MSWRDSVDDADAATRAFMDGFKKHLIEARRYYEKKAKGCHNEGTVETSRKQVRAEEVDG